jgi:hypothetical protein
MRVFAVDSVGQPFLAPNYQSCAFIDAASVSGPGDAVQGVCGL